MTSKEGQESIEVYCSDLLRRLDRPLSFIGASRASFALIDDEWIDLDRYAASVKGDPEIRDRFKNKLRDRLQYLRERLASCPVSRIEALALYEEGVAVKRTILLLDQPLSIPDPDVHADTRRWLRYGRTIS